MNKNQKCAAAIGAVIILSAAMIVLRDHIRGDERIAYIYSNDELIETIDLNAVEYPYAFMVGENGGDLNIISFRKGEIGVIGASCPDKICMDTGYISSPALPIVCLPNKLVIEVRSSKNADDIDAVTR